MSDWADAPVHMCECCRRISSECLVLKEARQLRTPEGRKEAMEEYRNQLRSRADWLDGQRRKS